MCVFVCRYTCWDMHVGCVCVCWGSAYQCVLMHTEAREQSWLLHTHTHLFKNLRLGLSFAWNSPSRLCWLTAGIPGSVQCGFWWGSNPGRQGLYPLSYLPNSSGWPFYWVIVFFFSNAQHEWQKGRPRSGSLSGVTGWLKSVTERMLKATALLFPKGRGPAAVEQYLCE